MTQSHIVTIHRGQVHVRPDTRINVSTVTYVDPFEDRFWRKRWAEWDRFVETPPSEQVPEEPSGPTTAERLVRVLANVPRDKAADVIARALAGEWQKAVASCDRRIAELEAIVAGQKNTIRAEHQIAKDWEAAGRKKQELITELMKERDLYAQRWADAQDAQIEADAELAQSERETDLAHRAWKADR